MFTKLLVARMKRKHCKQRIEDNLGLEGINKTGALYAQGFVEGF